MPAVAQPDDAPQDGFGIGQTIADRYRIISKLGAGGMGTAYRAWDERSGVPVVIKIPKRVFLEDPKFAERFHREIRLLQGLNHPHIVPIVDVGSHENLPYVAMRFLPGGSLSNRRLRDEKGKARPNPSGMLHFWLPAVADALDFVHSQGVVHRDVKPANIFFDAGWEAYLGDFGIAKVVEESDTFDKEHTLTATHMGIGTQGYMSPEQYTPKAVIDGRADQYALAVMVYELLTGVRPFTGATNNLIVEVLTHPVPPLQSLRQGLPDSLCNAVHRGLSKKPGERFPTCREFVAAVLRDVPRMEDEPSVARLLCPQCSNILKLPTTAAGQKGKCPKCQSRMKVAKDLGALWLLDEARRQKSAAAASDAGEPVPDSNSTVATPTYEELAAFKPIYSTTPIASAYPRQTQLSPHTIAVGVMAALLLAAMSWFGVSILNSGNSKPPTYQAQLASALKKLEGNPSDPAANEFVGRHWCLRKRDWAQGLPYLAKSDVFGLSTLAEQERELGTSRTDNAGDFIRIAAKWWRLASEKEIGPPETVSAIQEHAADLYRQNVKSLTADADVAMANLWLDRDGEFQKLVGNRRPSELQPPKPLPLTSSSPASLCGAFKQKDSGFVWKFFPDGTLVIEGWGVGIWERNPDGSFLVTRRLPTLPVEKDTFVGMDANANTLRRQGDGVLLEKQDGEFVLLQSWNLPMHFIECFDSSRMWIRTPPSRHAVLITRPGLAGGGQLSFESAAREGHFVHVRQEKGSPVFLQKNDGSNEMRTSATFTEQSGLVDKDARSYCITSQPSKYLRHAGFLMWASEETAEDLFTKDATFRVVPAEHIAEWGVYLSDLQELESKVTHFGFGKGTINGPSNPIQSIVDGHLSPHGLSMHPGDGPNDQCFVKYRLPKGTKRLTATVTLNKSGSFDHCGIGFEVIADGKSVWKSQCIDKNHKSEDCNVAIEDCRDLELRTYTVTAAFGGHAVWIEPRIYVDSDNPAKTPDKSSGLATSPPADAITSAETGHAYKAFKERLSWKDAKQRCEQLGGHLVTISSPGEQAFAVECLKKAGVNVDKQDYPAAWHERFWAGGTDENAEGKWRWIDGSDWTFSAWVLNQPDGDGNFLSICPHITGQWNDDQPLPPSIAGFICEWEQEKRVAVAGSNPARGPPMESALKWLIAHQSDDGSWSFDLKQCTGCNGQCSHSGSYPDRAGATAMALLACLSRGFTHREGPYKKEVEAGLDYLAKRATSENGVLYHEGTHSLFVQAMAALALSECYSMTKDAGLRQPAQLALSHIMAMQDPASGGWPFRPGQQCDTVATVLQLTALKSGNLAGLQVSPLAVKKAGEFLGLVRVGNGSAYGATTPQDATLRSSAAGLLGQIYLGAKPDNVKLRPWEEQLVKAGPIGDVLCVFLSRQVLHFVQDPMSENARPWWGRWQELIKTSMASSGHEQGSWCDGLNEGAVLDGGRLYCTSLVAMTHGVYYRHLPIHRKESFSASLLKEAAEISSGPVLPDPGTLIGFKESVGKTLLLKVSGAAAGSVWGRNPYTADSLVGRAAVHAGVLRPGEEGVVSVTVLPGQKTYLGSVANGVTTGRWGAYGLSYRIDDAVTASSLQGTVMLNGKPFLTKAEPVLSSLSYLDAEGKQAAVNGARFDYDEKTGRYRLAGLPDQEKFLMWLFFQRSAKDSLHLGGQFLFSAYLINLKGVTLDGRADFPLNVEQVVHLRRPLDNGRVLAANVCPKLKSPVTVEWDEVVGAEAYEVEVSTWWRPEHPPGERPMPVRQRTSETKLIFTLEATKPMEYYRVAIKAFAGGKQIGDLMVVDESSYGWWADFVVQP